MKETNYSNWSDQELEKWHNSLGEQWLKLYKETVRENPTQFPNLEKKMDEMTREKKEAWKEILRRRYSKD